MGRKLFVGNLPFDTTEGDLQALFERVGAVETVQVMRDMATGRARGFAFVEMSSEGDAQRAVTELHNSQLGGRTLTVNEARPKVDSPRGFGGGGGGGRGPGSGGRGGRGPGGGGHRRSEPRW
jgi:RNA recognition motif-containing protein